MFSTFSPLFLTDLGTSGALLASGTTLSEGSSHDSGQFVSIFWITLVALLSPILSRLTGKKIPDVVFLLIFGLLIGPNMLNLASSEGGIPLLKELGLGMLFLIAGFEINVSSLRSRQGYSAITTWVMCFALGMTGAAVITSFSHELNTYIAVGVALSSTALGTLLPMLKSHGAAGTPVGNAVLVHGAVGELLPIFAISLLLSSRSPGMAIVVLLAFMVVAVITALIPHRLSAHVPGLRQIMAAGANTTGQTVLRLAMFLLATLIMCTALFDLDAVLGAFAAGLILRTLTPPAALHMITRRLEVVGFTFMIPLFFVVSGMGIDVSTVVACRGGGYSAVPRRSGSFGGAFLRYPFGVDYSRAEGAVGVVFGCGSADYCGGDGGCDQLGSSGGVHGVAAGCRRRADGSAVPAVGVGYSSGVWFWSAGAAGAEP